ncbi:MAG: isocitrate/isopropylmalate dehydrogenase family protein [Acidobacteriota bacterium]
MKRIAVVPGDGIGPEVTRESVKVLEVLSGQGLPLAWEEFDFNADRYLETGSALPPGGLEFLAEFDAVLVGAFGDPRIPDMAHGRQVLLGLRTGWDLYVNLRPALLLNPKLSPLAHTENAAVDLLIFRENTAGPYANAGGAVRMGTSEEVAVQESIETRGGVERLVRYAFQSCRKSGRSPLTLVDKHNAMRFTGDLWFRTFRETARDFPQVETEHFFVDAFCMELVRSPGRFRAVVTDNLFGDIASDVAAAMAGGPGMAPSVTLNPETGRAVFEPVHGSAPDIAGRGLSNPMASILSTGLMLEHLGFSREAGLVRDAVKWCLLEGKATRDAGGNLGTAGTGDCICERLLAEY